jgi:hypothetical protein
MVIVASHGVMQVGDKRQEVGWDANGGTTEVDIEVAANAKLWVEFSPNGPSSIESCFGFCNHIRVGL